MNNLVSINSRHKQSISLDKESKDKGNILYEGQKTVNPRSRRKTATARYDPYNHQSPSVEKAMNNLVSMDSKHKQSITLDKVSKGNGNILYEGQKTVNPNRRRKTATAKNNSYNHQSPSVEKAMNNLVSINSSHKQCISLNKESNDKGNILYEGQKTVNPRSRRKIATARYDPYNHQSPSVEKAMNNLVSMDSKHKQSITLDKESNDKGNILYEGQKTVNPSRRRKTATARNNSYNHQSPSVKKAMNNLVSMDSKHKQSIMLDKVSKGNGNILYGGQKTVNPSRRRKTATARNNSYNHQSPSVEKAMNNLVSMDSKHKQSITLDKESNDKGNILYEGQKTVNPSRRRKTATARNNSYNHQSPSVKKAMNNLVSMDSKHKQSIMLDKVSKGNGNILYEGQKTVNPSRRRKTATARNNSYNHQSPSVEKAMNNLVSMDSKHQQSITLDKESNDKGNILYEGQKTVNPSRRRKTATARNNSYNHQSPSVEKAMNNLVSMDSKHKQSIMLDKVSKGNGNILYEGQKTVNPSSRRKTATAKYCNSNSKQYFCNTCQQSYLYETSLFRHYKLKHTEYDTNNLISQKTNSDDNELKILDNSKDNDLNSTGDIGSNQRNFITKQINDKELRNLEDKGKNEFVCEKCELFFDSITKLNIHNQENHNLKTTSVSIKCFVCQKIFCSIDDLLFHVSQTHQYSLSKYCCKLCGMPCKNGIILLAHLMKSCTIDKKCKLCDLNFSNKKDLRQHMVVHQKAFILKKKVIQNLNRSHTKKNQKKINEEKFQCSYCTKLFNSKGSLQIHERFHTGERPFRCHYCKKRFADNGSLNKHERIHTGEKPYVCLICEKAFNQRVLLRDHISSQHANIKHVIVLKKGETLYKCQLCDVLTSSIETFRSHLIKHSDENTAKYRSTFGLPRKNKLNHCSNKNNKWFIKEDYGENTSMSVFDMPDNECFEDEPLLVEDQTALMMVTDLNPSKFPVRVNSDLVEQEQMSVPIECEMIINNSEFPKTYSNIQYAYDDEVANYIQNTTEFSMQEDIFETENNDRSNETKLMCSKDYYEEVGANKEIDPKNIIPEIQENIFCEICDAILDGSKMYVEHISSMHM